MRISFIIIEYHSIEDVIACYLSILDQIPSGWLYEVIISSNSVYSLVEQNEIISKNKSLKWVFNARNGGFAYAMNKGLAIATGDFLVIMNPDVRLRYGLEEIVNYLRAHSEMGIVAPKIVNSDKEVQDSFRKFVTPVSFLKRHLKRILKLGNNIETNKSTNTVDWVIGAFMIVSRQAYETLKGFDEHYFLYCEDMDFCKRMYLSGYSVGYYPQAEIEYEGTRSARRSLKYAHIFLKSLFRYWRKFGVFN